jgi:hypothetical protein
LMNKFMNKEVKWRSDFGYLRGIVMMLM